MCALSWQNSFAKKSAEKNIRIWQKQGKGEIIDSKLCVKKERGWFLAFWSLFPSLSSNNICEPANFLNSTGNMRKIKEVCFLKDDHWWFMWKYDKW